MIRYFDSGQIYFADSCQRCIAIKQQYIKVRDHRLQIKYFSILISKSKSNKVCKELNTDKHIITFLSHSPANKITKAIFVDSPDGVIRAIANAALNLQQNPDVKLNNATRNLFSTYSRSCGIITDHKISIENKRKHLTQKGGAFPFLGPLHGSALLSIGSGFISRIFNRRENNE